jgi:beta-lactamase superfamily II metal-dependent hydrolase
MAEFGYEIDFIPVGDGERSGDAIALRYGTSGSYTIHVIDGGDQDAGDLLIEHIKQYYGNPSLIDHVILTHADDDHSSGLRKVIEEFDIGTIWMNRSWLYAAEVINGFKDPRWTVPGLEKRLREDFPILTEIEDLASQKEIPIREAFQGARVGEFTILSPSCSRYLELIPQFSRTPEAAEATNIAGRAIEGIKAAVERAVEWISETWGKETLEENPETSPANESSIVQFGQFVGERVLLTGDAGVVSLDEAADFANELGTVLPGFRFIQVPHHGSRHNVSPSVLDRLLGEPLPEEGKDRGIAAFASVSMNDNSKPRKKVVNAFMRRGAKVYVTRGKIRHQYNMPGRVGWTAVTALSFSEKVEA